LFRQPVTSSNLRAVGYDAATNIMEIEFHASGVYRYFGVPEHAYRGLMNAASKGTYFADFIKGIYRFVKI